MNERNLASIGANPLAHMLATGEWSELHEREYEHKGASARGLLAVLAVSGVGQQLHRRSARYPQYAGFTDALDPTQDEWLLLNDGTVRRCRSERG